MKLLVLKFSKLGPNLVSIDRLYELVWLILDWIGANWHSDRNEPRKNIEREEKRGR